MSHEIVTRSHLLSNYNQDHKTELVAHSDNLTASEAARINRYFDIEVYVGAHGESAPVKMEKIITAYNKPYSGITQEDYSAFGAVVESMQIGDVLFRESYGFKKQPDEPSFLLSLLHQAAGTYRRGKLEDERKNFGIGTFDYAERLAEINSIQTVYADYDAFEAEALKTLAHGMDVRAKAYDECDSYAMALAQRVHPNRVRIARNTVKDWALDHLPPAGKKSLRGRKPKLVLLFGAGHREELDQAFRGMGLRAKVVTLGKRY
jgi:hypothetical protein